MLAHAKFRPMNGIDFQLEALWKKDTTNLYIDWLEQLLN